MEVFFSAEGMKLMEHSYIENPFVNTFEYQLTKNGMFYKSRVVWGGDYADNEQGIDKNLHRITNDFPDKNLTTKLRDEDIKSTKDYPYIQKMNEDFQKQFYTLYFPVFILLIFFSLFSILTYHIHHNKFIFYFSFFILFLLIPILSSFLSTYFVFRDYNDSVICELKGYSKNVEISIRNGIHNLYQAIVKYNYPCFQK